MSSSREVLASIAPEERSKPMLNLDVDDLPVERTLGVVWDAESDVFQFKVKMESAAAETTKRHVLSKISTLYDPLGLVSPVTLFPKGIMQDLWRQIDLEWDSPVPTEFEKAWRSWRDQLHLIEQLRVPRCIKFVGRSPLKITLHTFCDASTKGFGAVVYQRTTYNDNSVSIRLVMSKARVMPLKFLSTPKGELQAAIVGLRVGLTVAAELGIATSNCTFWSDSGTVIAWIHSVARKYRVFVANRIAEILEETRLEQWRHVPGELNPVDELSRGTFLLRNGQRMPDIYLPQCLPVGYVIRFAIPHYSVIAFSFSKKLKVFFFGRKLDD